MWRRARTAELAEELDHVDQVLRWTEATRGLRPDVLALVQCAHDLYRRAKTYRARIRNDLEWWNGLGNLADLRNSEIWSEPSYQRDREHATAYLTGDAENVLSLIDRIGDSLDSLIERVAERRAIVSFVAKWGEWFKLPAELRNAVFHDAKEIAEKGRRTAIVGIDGETLSYATEGPTNPGRRLEIYPNMLDELDKLWEEFVTALEGSRTTWGG